MKTVQRFLIWSCVAIWVMAGTVHAGKEAVIRPANELNFEEIGPGISKVILWGNPETGPYGALVRWAEAHRNPRRAFSEDIHIAVISGTFVYDNGDGEVDLEPDSHLEIPAGTPHISGAGEEGCLFLLDSKGPHEPQPAEE